MGDRIVGKRVTLQIMEEVFTAKMKTVGASTDFDIGYALRQDDKPVANLEPSVVAESTLRTMGEAMATHIVATTDTPPQAVRTLANFVELMKDIVKNELTHRYKDADNHKCVSCGMCGKSQGELPPEKTPEEKIKAQQELLNRHKVINTLEAYDPKVKA